VTPTRRCFSLGGSFRISMISTPASHWLDAVANPRVHATTQARCQRGLREKKRAQAAAPAPSGGAETGAAASHEAWSALAAISTACQTPRPTVFDVHVFADAIRIFEGGALIAVHAPLEDVAKSASIQRLILTRAGDLAARRPLSFL